MSLPSAAGGHVSDRAADGTVCRWARVLAYEPPTRVVISWDINPYWQVETDPAKTSEVEVFFHVESPTRTRVELQHRHLDRHGEGWGKALTTVWTESRAGLSICSVTPTCWAGGLADGDVDQSRGRPSASE
jgi:uncharacterized protein YndB with AHSA1/START domain